MKRESSNSISISVKIGLSCTVERCFGNITSAVDVALHGRVPFWYGRALHGASFCVTGHTAMPKRHTAVRLLMEESGFQFNC